MTTQQKERPIIFSGPMVRAILAGRKTVTRRIVSKANSECAMTWDRLAWDDASVPKPAWGSLADNGYLHIPTMPHPEDPQDDPSYWTRQRVYPKWVVGDRLWVRETYCQKFDDGYPVYNSDGNLDPSRYHYRADGYYVMKCDGDGGMEFTASGREASPWRSPIFMPRWASRITLEITRVSVERLHDITDEDAAKEGFGPDRDASGHVPRDQFALLWDTINGRGAWSANPWVWRIEFRREQP